MTSRLRRAREDWESGHEEGYPRCCVAYFAAASVFTSAPAQLMNRYARKPDDEWQWCSERNAALGGFCECPLHYAMALWSGTGYWLRMQTRYEETERAVVTRWRVLEPGGWTPWHRQERPIIQRREHRGLVMVGPAGPLVVEEA